MYLSQNMYAENTLTDIATHFDVIHTSVIHVLKLLEKKGFICKRAVQGIRTKPILLTDNGRQLILDVSQKRPLLDEIMFAGLSETEQQFLENARADLSKSGIRCIQRFLEFRKGRIIIFL